MVLGRNRGLAFWGSCRPVAEWRLVSDRANNFFSGWVPSRQKVIPNPDVAPSCDLLHGLTVPLPSQIIAHYRMERYALKPVGNTFVLNSHGSIELTPIKVARDVLVEWHDSTVPQSTRFRRGVACNRLCQTLLYRDGVTTVTMSNIAPLSGVELVRGEPGRAISSATFRRKPAAECQAVTHPHHVATKGTFATPRLLVETGRSFTPQLWHLWAGSGMSGSGGSNISEQPQVM